VNRKGRDTRKKNGRKCEYEKEERKSEGKRRK
jgi:hypothetical protein